MTPRLIIQIAAGLSTLPQVRNSRMLLVQIDEISFSSIFSVMLLGQPLFLH
jgi:hypothetical protein